MLMYVIRVNKINQSKVVTLPAALCRALGLVVGDTMILQPQMDGTVVIFPPKLMPELMKQVKERAAQTGRDNE